MGSVSQASDQGSISENEIMTGDKIDSATKGHVTSLNMGIAKISECSDGHYKTCFMNEPFVENVKISERNLCDISEYNDDSQKVGQYINSGSSDRHCINQDFLLQDISTVPYLVDGTITEVNKNGDHMTLIKSKQLNIKYENDVNIEIMPASHNKNYSYASHLNSFIPQTNNNFGLNVSSFQKDYIVHNSDDVCNKFMKQVERTTFSAIKTGKIHESVLCNEQCESDKLNISNSSHEHTVSLKTMQQSAYDTGSRRTSSSIRDTSDNVHHLKVVFNHSKKQESGNTDVQNSLLASKIMSADLNNSDLNQTHFVNGNEDLLHVLEDNEKPAEVLERLFIQTESQGNKSVIGENLKLSSAGSAGVCCSSSVLSSVIKENNDVLNCLQKNCVDGSAYFSTHSSGVTSETLATHSNGASSEASCKVVTKYVFINKASRQKSSKKYFGVLYKQAFRHFSRATLNEKKMKKKKPIKKPGVDTEKKPIKKPGADREKSVSGDILEGKCQKQNREACNQSREERRLAREVKKNSNSEVNKRITERRKPKKRGKRKEKDAERTSGSNTRIPNVVEKKSKQERRKSLRYQDGVVEKTDERFQESYNRFKKKKGGISRTEVWTMLKKKQESIAVVDSRLLAEVKKMKKRKETCAETTHLKIKEEISDEEKESNQKNVDDTEGMNVQFQKSKSKMRNRKDLTLQEKVQAIGALEMPGSKLVSVAKRFGVSVSAISRINKNREYIRLQSISGDLNSRQRRSRECKDPVLDKILLNWFHAIENLHSGDTSITISNVLIKEKAHDLAIVLGKNYFPSDNWIIRWKNRHNLGSKYNSSAVVINDREVIKELDSKVNISEILDEMGKQEFKIDQVKRQSLMRRGEKPEELFICEHCGVLTSTKKKKANNHLAGCPASSVRKDLTLEEKVQVVRALEQPGVKMVTLAKKYGVSASAISRIHKNRVDILARRASGLANCARRRDRGSKEPEVEKVLCEWFKVQHELGIHISGSMIREKARDIAKVMGKDFWPSESWVFRWRHRNNVTDVNTFLYGDSDEGDLGGLERTTDNVEDAVLPNSSEDSPMVQWEEEATGNDTENTQIKRRKEKFSPDELPVAKQFRLPRSVMCEKCGFVSCRVKNNRMKSLRHAKGCPDLKPRNELTYENRGRMLKALEEPGATLSSVARQFGVSVSSMSRMNQKKDQILSHCEEHADQKRIRDCKEPEVAYRLYQWYMEKKAEGVHVTGPKLKEKARKVAAQFGREFNASSGWLGRWRHRYNIINSTHNSEKIARDSSRKRSRKNIGNKLRLPENQVIPCEFHQESVGSAESAIVEPIDDTPQLSQAGPVFIHQRFHNPWDIGQQQTDSCVWTKEFLNPAGPSSLDATAGTVAYTYGDNISKPVFHNVFDSFSAVGYQVAMPLDTNVVLSREYLKQDIGDDKFVPSSGSHMSHSNHSSHNPHSHHLPTHLHHHIPVSHPHSLTHPQVQLHPHVTQPLPPPSSVTLEDDPEQQLQVLEAFKIMSSFAQKKSLGDQVQAALRTIELSMKSSVRKAPPSTRSSYTSI